MHHNNHTVADVERLEPSKATTTGELSDPLLDDESKSPRKVRRPCGDTKRCSHSNECWRSLL